MAISMSSSAASHRAYQILHFGFTLAPIVAGADKFFHYLCNWDKYLWSGVAQYVPAHTFMMVVGAIEIVAGLLVLAKPRMGGFVVMAWLFGIVVNLLLTGTYFDIALRDFGLALGAMALGFLAMDHEGHTMAVHERRTASPAT